MFSKACEYAFRAATVIASASAAGERLSLKEIAEKTDAPPAFTAKVLQELAKADIILSFKGPRGGFDLAPLQARKVKLISPKSHALCTTSSQRSGTSCSAPWRTRPSMILLSA